MKLFFTGDEGETCEAVEIAELHTVDCENDAPWYAEDRDTGEQTPLCDEHKEALKAAGLAS